MQLLNMCMFGDCRESMREMIAQGVRVEMCVTSPPYWGLRDYGTATWDGGSAGCEHIAGPAVSAMSTLGGGKQPGVVMPFRGDCGKCGARRIDSQLGLESTPDCGRPLMRLREFFEPALCGECYVCRMVEVFRLVRDLLADDGTLWLNLGDSYANTGATDRRMSMSSTIGRSHGGAGSVLHHAPSASVGAPSKGTPLGLKPKDLVGIPWRVAFALQADGWYLRSDIIWAKKNCMPESVTDRPTKAHEYLFLLSKRERYFYDADAIAEPAINAGRTVVYDGSQKNCETAGDPRFATRITSDRTVGNNRNRRTVWTVATEPYAEAHFATFPTALIEPCILAGTSQKGHCPACGKGWVRVVEQDVSGFRHVSPKDNNPHRKDGPETSSSRLHSQYFSVTSKTTGWQPSCACALEPVPGIVFDPFLGSGTTAQVAQDLGRNWLGCELNAEYGGLQDKRAAQMGLALT